MAGTNDRAPQTLGERVTYALRLRGMNQIELDRAIGSSSGYVSRLARDQRERPDAILLQRAALALRVSSDWLIAGIGDLPLPEEGDPAAVSPPQGRPPEDVDAKREAAAEWAYEDGVSDEAIRAVLAEPVRLGDMNRSRLWWANRMKQMDARLSEAWWARDEPRRQVTPPAQSHRRSGAK
jgi:transcriptional regulator with XRE-family HTH domain